MELYIWLLVFVVGFGILLWEGKPDWKKKAFYCSICMGIMIAMASLRYGIGFDYQFYKESFQANANMSWTAVWENPREVSFFILCKGISYFTKDYTVFLWIVNSFLFGVVFWFIGRYSRRIWLSVFFFICLQQFALFMNLLRQSIAACFFLLAVPALLDRKGLRYIFLVCFGATFHRSLLMVLPFYFILTREITKKRIAVLCLCTLGLYLWFDTLFYFFCKIFPISYEKYVDSLYWQGNSFYYILYPFIYCFIALIYYKKSKHKDLRIKVFVNAAIYQFLISVFITKHFVIERLAIYFSFFAIVLLPDLEDAFCKKMIPMLEPKKQRMALCCILLVLGISYFSFAAVAGFHHVYPYYSIFDRIGEK